jgi:hypothetical protein
MMKRIVTTLALLAVCAAPALAANPVRISQVYGGGGATSGSPTYSVDYVEIYNSGNVAVNIGGWTIEYGSAAGNWGSSALNQFTFPVGTTIQPCQYMLTSQGTAGTVGAPLPVAPDFSGTLTMSATSGKVALFSALNNNLACGAELPGTLVDKVSYGTGNCPETTNVGTLANTTGAVRNGAGNTDTDNNFGDFTITTNPVPRNSQSARNAACMVTPTHTSTWGSVKAIYR